MVSGEDVDAPVSKRVRLGAVRMVNDDLSPVKVGAAAALAFSPDHSPNNEVELEDAPAPSLGYVDQVKYSRWRRLLIANLPGVKFSKEATLAIAQATLCVTQELVFQTVERQLEAQHGHFANSGIDKVLTLHERDLIETLNCSKHPHKYVWDMLALARELRARDAQEFEEDENEDVAAARPSITLHNFFPATARQDGDR